ncbi:SnoaL-like domain-containing protein [Spirosoma aureum]|uniref:SnoaL-like domain-containing protein n=1 Tax=Spirosoma aureum TaxID=2692134 RepID=A0A6G9AQG5_9BACT|nr:nuclear transport factor 2 family protein [Spirosoma aureum]QIP14453.1 SnoaL-like domain-containing protein [Spirosoma aureum]
MDQHSINKTLIRDFYRRALGQGDIDFARAIVADGYIQHSSMGKPDKAGLLESLEAFGKMPKPVTTSKPFMRLLAEGDYVVTNMSFGWGDSQKVVVDLFRFENGQVIEHWDAIQDQPESTHNGNAMMDGAVEADTTEPTETNKAVVADYYQRVLIQRQTDRLADFVAVDLVQHNPEIANGTAGLLAYFSRGADDFSMNKVHRIIGEGNFVVVQAEGELAGKPTVFYDIFRLIGGEIVEQWAVSQAIPANMPHENGIL